MLWRSLSKGCQLSINCVLGKGGPNLLDCGDGLRPLLQGMHAVEAIKTTISSCKSMF